MLPFNFVLITMQKINEKIMVFSVIGCVSRESQRELEERNNEVLDLDTALKERQGELQQRAQLVPHTNMSKISLTAMSPLY